MSKTFLFLTGFLVVIVAVTNLVRAKEYLPIWLTPEQVHLSLGVNTAQMVVTWVTVDRPNGTSTVRYGIGNRVTDVMNLSAKGTTTEYLDKSQYNVNQRTIYIHRVYLNDLKPETTYKYQPGHPGTGWGNVFFFTTLPAPGATDWSPNILIIGDLGNLDAMILAPLEDEVQQTKYDLMLHVGDFAYDLDDDDGKVGDAYFREIEPIVATMPYQVCPGNHEKRDNFSQYNNRFTMHSEGSSEMNNFFWSYNFGPIHFISFTTEFYYFPEFGTHQIMNQYRWLEADLKKANQNRDKQPWIVTMAHRPMYNQFYINEELRVGNATAPGFEKLFFEQGVDLAFWGHDHIYERIWPIYDKVLRNGNVQPYTDPTGIVHITTGSAGCFLLPPPLNPKMPAFNALASRDFSYTRMKVFNHTHLRLQQVNNKAQMIDEIYLIKHKHGPYPDWH